MPTAVTFGSFVVPVAWVMRTSDRNQVTEVTPGFLIKAFVCGGTLGFLSSALLESPFLSIPPAVFNLGVGLIEEAAKALALVWIARRLGIRSPAAGFVLGAAVGFGFEAFEDAGYNVSALAASGGPAWSAMVTSELTRAITAPVTHGLWTAILGAVLFHESRDGRFRPTVPLAGAFAAVAGLHYLWDLVPNISLGVDLRLFDLHSAAILPQSLPVGASRIVSLFNDGIDDVGLVLVGISGVFAAHLVRQRFGLNRDDWMARRRERAWGSSRVAILSSPATADDVAVPLGRRAGKRVFQNDDTRSSESSFGSVRWRSPLALTARYSLADRHPVAPPRTEPPLFGSRRRTNETRNREAEPDASLAPTT